MLRLSLILLILSGSNITMSQNAIFDSLVRNLYFEVDLSNKSAAIVDSFSKVKHLKQNKTVVRQWDLNATIFDDSDEEAWTARYTFTFKSSPVPGLKINTGQIVVSMRETAKAKKFIAANWQVDFKNKTDGEIFYNKLKELFAPISTKQKVEYDDSVGYIAQYSIRNETSNRIRDISFSFGKSSQTGKYRISLSLFNEFAAEENR